MSSTRIRVLRRLPALLLPVISACGGDGRPSPVGPVVTTDDYAVVGAQFTQGVQDAAGSIPMVTGGSAAVVNVLMRGPGTSSSVPAMDVALRITTASGELVRADTVRMEASTGVASYSAPSVQFLVPASVLRAGLVWQVIRDPRRVLVDADAANDRYPPVPAPLATVDVAPLNIRFVPITLAAHGDAAPAIVAADLPAYLRTLRSIAPIGQVNATIAPTLVTSANFGSPPRGGERAFWTQLLGELEFARVTHPTESGANWYGIVAPPPGFTFTGYGGFSLVSSSTSGAPVARSSLSVRLGWFSRATQARDLVAHELGHSFGRLHTPCGDADAPIEPGYPSAAGTLDVAGHDVYSWANGLATRAATVDVTSGDVMGYCFPAWSSVFTYKAILAFRQRLTTVAVGGALVSDLAVRQRTRVMILRGTIDAGADGALARVFGERLEIQPAYAMDAVPTPPSGGRYRAEGVDADGRVLFAHAFEPMAVDHAPGTSLFVLAVPVSTEFEARVVRTRVVGPTGELGGGAVRAIAR